MRVCCAVLSLTMLLGVSFSRAASSSQRPSESVPMPTPATRPRTVSSNARQPDPGPGGSLHGKQLFPPDNPWNQDISTQPVDPNSANLIASIGLSTGLHPDFGTVWNGAPNGIPYVVVPGTQPRVPILFTLYPSESDAGPYPVPSDAPIEGGPNG